MRIDHTRSLRCWSEHRLAAACSSSTTRHQRVVGTGDHRFGTVRQHACAAGGDVTLEEIEVIFDGTTCTAVVHVPAGATAPSRYPSCSHSTAPARWRRTALRSTASPRCDQHGFVSAHPGPLR
jgi:hypothetical protein